MMVQLRMPPDRMWATGPSPQTAAKGGKVGWLPALLLVVALAAYAWSTPTSFRRCGLVMNRWCMVAVDMRSFKQPLEGARPAGRDQWPGNGGPAVGAA